MADLEQEAIRLGERMDAFDGKVVDERRAALTSISESRASVRRLFPIITPASLH